MVENVNGAEPTPANDGGPRRIAMLIYPGVAPLDVAGPLQVFGFSNFLTKQPLYEIMTVAPTAEPVPTGLGFAFIPACAMAALPLPIDTLLVSGGGPPGTVKDPAILEWLAQTAPKARRFGSICTGVFILGDAGLIDGKRVTTHWALGGELASLHPTARVEVDAIFVRDGKLCSSAGITAGIDLALALLEEDHGRELALKVARYLVLFLKRSGGQAQFSTQLQAQFSSIPAIQEVQLWSLDHLADDLHVSALARRAAMSERSFIRAFRDDTGRTPGEFVMSARLQAACRLLAESEFTLKEVAQRCGLGTAATMRRLFMDRLGVSPAHYRDKFRVHEVIAARMRPEASHTPAP
jgi:transcriptional regulator GlxA family with amidase domain